MNGAIEAAGDVATGAAWSVAAEPRTGEAIHSGSGACLNCATTLAGRYCHGCGQSSHVHRTLMSIGHDLLHGVFHFEGKIWRTIPMLVLHPGQLTRRYIAGERARFVSPLALFLFTVFLMFATYSAVGSGEFSDSFVKGWQTVPGKMAEERARGAAQIAALQKERAGLVLRGSETARLDRRIAEQQENLATLTRVTGKMDARPGAIEVHSKLDWFDRALQKAKANPGLAVYKVQSATYKFSWALILLSTPLVALLFLWRRRYGLYDHATFVTYSISFMSLLAIVLELLIAIGGPKPLIASLALGGPPVHMFAQLRGAYTLRPFSALWRTIALLAMSTATLVFFVVAVIALEVTH